jgi:hypothetical protein
VTRLTLSSLLSSHSTLLDIFPLIHTTDSLSLPVPISLLRRLTVLLTMMGDGSMGVDDVSFPHPPLMLVPSSCLQIVSSTQKKILTTLNDPRFKKTASDIARDRLTRVLVSLRESEETLTGKSVSGFHFFKEFNLTNFSDAQDSISQTMRDIADHTGVS